MKYAEVQNCIGGAFVSPDAPTLDVYDPSSGAVLSRVPLSSARDVDAAVVAAKAAFPAWSTTPIKERVQVLYRYKTLLERNIDELAALVTEENGKIANEARAEVLKSAELTEFACSLPQIVTGEVLEVSRGVECRVERFPVGVVAALSALIALAYLPIRSSAMRWGLALLTPFVLAWAIYSMPVWMGADPSEYSVWAVLFVVLWGGAGALASSLVVWSGRALRRA